jgi:cystathionine beta-lyase family protein involved in aluminum resistance
VAGKAPLVRAAARRLSAPGVGGGATLGQNKWILQGLFQSPGTVGESVKGALLLAQVLGGHFGLLCNPPPGPPAAPQGSNRALAVAAPATLAAAPATQPATLLPLPRPRTDIVQAVQLGGHKELVAFCEALQRNSPVGAYVKPTPGASPGYGGDVIFADGSFVDGATSELSCDGPLRPPYTVFVQGGTHHAHWALVLEAVVADLLEAQGR